MKALVTGANGFLGHHLVERLLRLNFQVTVLVRQNSDLSELDEVDPQKKSTKIYGDLSDLNSLKLACAGQDYVFHLAGLVAYRKKDRAQMETVNVQGTQNMILACQNLPLKRFIYISSVVAVGAAFTPDHTLNEKSEYNISKLDLGYFETKRKAEILVLEAVKKSNLPALIFNPSTIYGAGDAKKGSRKTQIKVAQGKFPFYTRGGVNVVSVHDVIDAVISGLEKARIGERYILSGENLSIQKLFQMIAAEAQVQPPKILMPKAILILLGTFFDFLSQFGISGPISLENAYTSTLYHWFDSSKAKQELGFNPRPAKQAIHESVQWMKKNSLLTDNK